MKALGLFCLLLILPLPVLAQRELTSDVDPFIGTGGHGHTYPGATMPFGMVQLSPDTRLTGWDGVSGYHYSDALIYGFSHTHLSGTGISDYCDVLLMPTLAEAFQKADRLDAPRLDRHPASTRHAHLPRLTQTERHASWPALQSP